jgi:CheY-like chemotaxis protein
LRFTVSDTGIAIPEDGQEALDQLSGARDAKEPFGLILTDMHMPKMDGFTLIEHIRERPELATATIMSLRRRAAGETPRRCLDLGVAAYLLEPIRHSELREAIARVLGAQPQEGALPLITRFSLHDARDPAAYLRVLLAEDRAVNQRLATRLLEKRGHRAAVAWPATARKPWTRWKRRSSIWFSWTCRYRRWTEWRPLQPFVKRRKTVGCINLSSL